MTGRKFDFQSGTNPFFLVAVIGGVLIIIMVIALVTVMKFDSAGQPAAQSARDEAAGEPDEAGADRGESAGDSETAGEERTEDLLEIASTWKGDDGLEGDGPGAGEDVDTGEGELSRLQDGGGESDPAALIEALKQEISDGWDDLLATFEKEGISVDLEKKQVSVKGVIIRDKESRRYPIEYVVVSEGGNTHEALILIKATPSNLNAALLAIGLEPGKTVIFRKKDPPPPAEDVEAGRVSPYEVVPPQGTLMKIYVQYDGWEDGKPRFLEDLILDIRTNKSLKRVGWIYVGSRFARVLLGRDRVTRYMADMERNVVALYLTGYGNAIFDINTADGVDDSLFDVNPEKAPPMNAVVTLLFSLEEIG